MYVAIQRVGLAAILALCASVPALADEYGSFKSFCLDTHGARGAAVAQATSAGWTKMDMSKATPPSTGAFKFTDYEVFTTASGPAKQMLMVGTGAGPSAAGAPPMPADMCMVVGPLEADAASKTAAWVGTAPTISMNIPSATATGKLSIFMFTDSPGGRKALDAAALQNGPQGLSQPLTLVMTMEMGTQAGMLGYIVMKPAPAAKPTPVPAT